MGSLPPERCTQQETFDFTGVDYVGPFYVCERVGRGRHSFKSYVSVFVWMVTRAVHLELVDRLNTPSFLPPSIALFCVEVNRKKCTPITEKILWELMQI